MKKNYHTTIKESPESLKTVDQVKFIRMNIQHNKQPDNLPITRGDFVRLFQ